MRILKLSVFFGLLTLLVGCYGSAYALDYPRGLRVNSDNHIVWESVKSDEHKEIEYQIRWLSSEPNMTHDFRNISGTFFDPKTIPAADLPSEGQKLQFEVRAIVPGSAVAGQSLVQTYYSRWNAVNWTRAS
ncbi:MAG: hypothetical protein FWE31_01615 [Firmicutes bacterium]|nr:hypothetical protein [Bacillota bacterium]